MYLQAMLITVCLAATCSNALVTRQTNPSNSQLVDLNGPQVRYEGPWLNFSSPCELGRTSRSTDNSRAEDAKAIITFGAEVEAFTISVQTQTDLTNYIIETLDKSYNYNADDNATPTTGQAGCPVLLTHNFGTASGSKVVNVTLRMPRSAKRDLLFARQGGGGGFRLPGIQINRVEGLLSRGDNADTPGAGSGIPNNGTAPPSGGEGAASSDYISFMAASLVAGAALLSLQV